MNIATLFGDTVRRTNGKDYSSRQIATWAPDKTDLAEWRKRLLAGRALVAEGPDGTLGFIRFDCGGHIDMLYTHADFQRKGIGSGLLAEAMREARELRLSKVFTEASITARSFFMKHGFTVLGENEVEIRGVSFVNYRMERRL